MRWFNCAIFFPVFFFQVMPKLPTCSAVRVPKSFAALKNQPFANWNHHPACPWKRLIPNSHGIENKQTMNPNLLRIRRSVLDINDEYCFLKKKHTDREDHLDLRQWFDQVQLLQHLRNSCHNNNRPQPLHLDLVRQLPDHCPTANLFAVSRVIIEKSVTCPSLRVSYKATSTLDWVVNYEWFFKILIWHT